MVIEVLDGRGFCIGGIRELQDLRRLGVQELCGYVVSLGDQWFRVPSIRPIAHGMEGVNAWGFVEVIRSGIVDIHIISILHLHQICDEICLQNSIQCGWVKVLP